MCISLCSLVVCEDGLFIQWSRSDTFATESLFVASSQSTPVFSLDGEVNNGRIGIVFLEKLDENSGMCVGKLSTYLKYAALCKSCNS